MFKVFPAHLTRDKQKVPLITGWREKATTDPEQIRLWQELFRDRITFWGIPCGEINGIMVLDVDVKDPSKNGWNTLKEKNLFIPDTLTQPTASGGRHFIFKYNANRDPGNKVGFLPGLDIRSQGGWIVHYGIEDYSKPILDAPDWIFENATAKQQVPQTEAVVKFSPEIAQGIFQACIDNIINAPTGQGNDVLNVESFKVGQLVASGSISREFAEASLFKSAKERGRPDYECRATIKSGLDGGLKHPVTSPFGNTAPQPLIEIPSVPGAGERWTPHYFTRQDLLNTSKLRKPQLFRDWSSEDITITTADGGTGKTTLKLYEAICLALGDRFLGFECKQRGKTLFITGEDTAAKLGAMIGAICNQMSLLEQSAENNARIDTILQSIVVKKDADLCLISRDRQGFLYPNKDAMEKLKQAVDDIRPKMIVFDPISSFWGSESALNDMNKAVTRFMSDLVEYSGAGVEMINHLGKSSSANKDMTQFAGRGGSGLPSNSRISRVMRSITVEEFREFTGGELVGDQTAILCNVNKFSDGSPLFNKPFVIVRNNYLFSRVTLTQMKARELEKQMDDNERVFSFVKTELGKNRWPTENVIIAHFMNHGDPITKEATKRAISTLEYSGHMGEKLKFIPNPDLTNKHKALIITDMDGKEQS